MIVLDLGQVLAKFAYLLSGEFQPVEELFIHEFSQPKLI
jgi:hypothetical protein